MAQGEADRRAALSATFDRVEVILNERADRVWRAIQHAEEEFNVWDLLAFTTKVQAQIGVAHFMDDEEYVGLVKSLMSWLYVLAILHIDELEGESDAVQQVDKSSSEGSDPA